MKFQDLSEDDIRSIFSFCDIYAVVSMSRTNRYFRRLSLDKLVWVDLVENIRRKGFGALVALVKSLLTGPACWNPIEPKRKWFRVTNSLPTQTLAEMSAKYVIHPSGIVYSKKREAKLLNGGEYVLFNNTTLECWSIRHDKLIWAYDKNGLEWSVCEFAAEVVDGGDSVNLIFWERLWTGGADDQSLAHIVNLDLKTGSSTGLLRIECSDPQFYGFTDVRICGDIASAAFQDWRSDHSTSTHHCNSYCILMNWRAKSQLKLAVKDFVFSFHTLLSHSSSILPLGNRESVPRGSHSRPRPFSREQRLRGPGNQCH
ncbi:hypothetical protein B0H13DRAFT_1993032 [Mycena leptocephala]|nr:hypothetical protein B0H13DRAFT_1993032 [Mycena leptocephala]